MPKPMLYAVVILCTLALIPPVLIMLARSTTSTKPRVHLIWDMDNQPKFKAQSANPLFADGRAMRPSVLGTVARGELFSDTRVKMGIQNNQWISTIPVEVDAAVMKRGQERYNIYCTPCHGNAGYGNGIVNARAERLQEGLWVPPSSLHDKLVRSRPDGHLFNTISNGIRTMPPYGSQIDVEDRWAIVAYVRALQRSQNATIDDVPQEWRASLK